MEEEHKGKIIKIDVAGKDPDLFSKIKGKLFIAVDKFLESVIDYDTGTTVKEETRKLASLALNFAEEKLKKTGIENQLILAQVDEKYAQIEKGKAETRKLNAEARKLDFDQSLKELSLSLRLTKALLTGKPGEENLMFVKQLDAFLDAINDVNRAQRLLD